jgi:hypothetical protein
MKTPVRSANGQESDKKKKDKQKYIHARASQRLRTTNTLKTYLAHTRCIQPTHSKRTSHAHDAFKR